MAHLRPPRRLSGGRVTAAIVESDVSDICVDGLPIAERLAPTLRDGRWRTMPISARSLDVATSDDTAEIVAEHHELGGRRPMVAWQMNVRVDDGGVQVDALARVVADLDARRIGLCLLLHWQPLIGARFRATGRAGRTNGTISPTIAPQYFRDGSFQPMFAAFSRLELDLPCGLHLDVRLNGEEFEMEDQRNWTDPTFKIYPGPLAESASRTFRSGDLIRQVVRIDVEGPRRARSPAPRARPLLTVGKPAPALVPDVGLPAVGLEASAPTRDVLRLLASAAPNHVRRSGHTAVAPPDVSEVRRLARSARAPIELALVVDQDGPHLDRWLNLALLIPAARLLLHRVDGVTSSASDLLPARRRLEGTATLLVGGTADQFSQLNRLPADADAGDGVSFAITPQAHSFDEESMIATLAIQRQVVESAVLANAGRPIIVSPVTLAMHDPADGLAPDTRITSEFAGAWTIGSYVQVALGGASSVTFHESAEHYAPASSESLPPAVRAAALAAGLSGRRMIPVHSTDPRLVTGIGGLAEHGNRTLLVTNLSNRPIEVDVVDDGSAVGPVRLSLASYAFMSVGLSALSSSER